MFTMATGHPRAGSRRWKLRSTSTSAGVVYPGPNAVTLDADLSHPRSLRRIERGGGLCCKVGSGLRKRRSRVQIRPRSRTGWQHLPLSDHRHPLVAGQRSSGGWQTAKAQTGSDQAFDAPMVLLDDVVQVFDLAQPGEAPQLTLALQGRDRGRIGRVLVHRERAWVDR